MYCPFLVNITNHFCAGNGKSSRAGFGIVPEELTEDNYDHWKLCLKNYLVGHDLWGVVSGKEAEPDKSKKHEHEEWKKKNALALHAIKMSSGSGVYSKFKEARISARYAWNHLAEKTQKPHAVHFSDHEDESSVEDHGGRLQLFTTKTVSSLSLVVSLFSFSFV